MTTRVEVAPASDRELVLSRIIDAPRAKVFKAWTDPSIIPQWFAPAPWSVSSARMDLRTGGATLVVMKSPEGQEFPNPGVILEVVPNEKLVFTDAYTKGWEPSARPFMTVVLTFEDAGAGKTKYTARAIHWSVEDREQQEKMGFHEGWGLCTEQLEKAAQKL